MLVQYSITFTYNIEIEEIHVRRIYTTCMRADYEMLRNKLNIDLKEFFGVADVEEMWIRFKTELEEVINVYQ